MAPAPGRRRYPPGAGTSTPEGRARAADRASDRDPGTRTRPERRPVTRALLGRSAEGGGRREGRRGWSVTVKEAAATSQKWQRGVQK